LQMPAHPDDEVISAAIQYMYGIGTADKQSFAVDPALFGGFPELAGVAERYEIAGLAEYSFETACRLLDSKLDHPMSLACFLSNMLNIQGHIRHSHPTHIRFTLRFLIENLTKLRNKPAFRKLCSGLLMTAVGVVSFVAENPELAADFVKLVAEIQSGVEKSKWTSQPGNTSQDSWEEKNGHLGC
jgi:hypothetical protein